MTTKLENLRPTKKRSKKSIPSKKNRSGSRRKNKKSKIRMEKHQENTDKKT